ncbi:MAG: helix-turn-helix domain-containing protein [Lentisphaerae bacterium]|nr:MAG: helix-turn-helix domain-containing protein [Lentisphaerota bacterium]
MKNTEETIYIPENHDELFNIGSHPPGCARTPEIELLNAWHVREDANYDVWRRSPERNSLIAVWGIAGQGKCHLRHGPSITLQANELQIIPGHQVSRYHTAGERWHFWWFEFQTSQPELFTQRSPIPIHVSPQLLASFTRISQMLRREDEHDRIWASTMFLHVLLQALTSHRRQLTRSPYSENIDRAINLMYEHIRGELSIPQLAGKVHMHERTFRSHFRQLTGESPKSFYSRIRLEMAQQLLSLGTYRIHEVAERLGFASPYHLSKAYCQHFGYPPSQEKPQETAFPS